MDMVLLPKHWCTFLSQDARGSAGRDSSRVGEAEEVDSGGSFDQVCIRETSETTCYVARVKLTTGMCVALVLFVYCTLAQHYCLAAPVEDIEAETTVNMMGAMPAVAVRLERRKAEKRLKRPSQLYLSGYNLRQTTSPNRASPTPSPLLSPPRDLDDAFLPEIYVCAKISALHLAVVSLLLGTVILIVGLVQLKPGADAPGHRYYLIAIGCALIALGLIITIARCILLHWKMERLRQGRKTTRHSMTNAADQAGKDGDTDGKTEPLSIDLKHLYDSSDVMFIDDSDTGRGTSPGESVATVNAVVASEARPCGPQPDACSLTMVSPTEFDTLLVGVHKGGGT